jgi:hypothetical protein
MNKNFKIMDQMNYEYDSAVNENHLEARVAPSMIVKQATKSLGDLSSLEKIEIYSSLIFIDDEAKLNLKQTLETVKKSQENVVQSYGKSR